MNRRTFSKHLLTTLSGYALIESLFATQAFHYAIRPIADHWAVQLNEYCADLKKQSLSLLEWQQKIEELYQQVELSELLKFIQFEQLIKGFSYPDLGVHTERVKFPKLHGLPARTAFVKKIFGMQKERAIIPHGHSNMASAHLVLHGEMHLRHYDKIGIDQEHMIIHPTIDKMVRPGESSSISDDKDNVHWMIAHTDQAFTFDVIMVDLNDKQYDIHNLDIYEKQDLSDGTMRVPMLDVETALKKYGKETHH